MSLKMSPKPPVPAPPPRLTGRRRRGRTGRRPRASAASRQHLVGFLRLLEVLLGLRDCPDCGPDATSWRACDRTSSGRLRSVPVDAQHFVVVALRHLSFQTNERAVRFGAARRSLTHASLARFLVLDFRELGVDHVAVVLLAGVSLGLAPRRWPCACCCLACSSAYIFSPSFCAACASACALAPRSRPCRPTSARPRRPSSRPRSSPSRRRRACRRSP